MKPVGHGIFHDGVGDVTRAMTGMKRGLGIVVCQSAGQTGQFAARLMPVQQVESSHYSPDRPWACRQDVFQSTMGAAGEKQSVGIESQLVPEIIGNKITICVLDE